jgi:hypothetical protein
VLRDPELGEQVIDHRTAVGIQDLALDRADPEMLQRGVHLGRHLGHALVDHRLHAFQHAFGAEGAHVLHLIGKDRVLERDVRHHQRAGLALVGRVLDCRGTAGRGLDEVEAPLALLDHHRGGGDALLPEQAELADPPRDIGHLVDGIGQRHHGEGRAGEDVQSGHQRCPLGESRASAGDDVERGELAERGGLLAAGDALGPDKLSGVDLGQAHDGDALGIGRGGVEAFRGRLRSMPPITP